MNLLSFGAAFDAPRTRQAISMIELGRVNITVRNLFEASVILGTPLYSIMAEALSIMNSREGR